MQLPGSSWQVWILDRPDSLAQLLGLLEPHGFSLKLAERSAIDRSAIERSPLDRSALERNGIERKVIAEQNLSQLGLFQDFGPQGTQNDQGAQSYQGLQSYLEVDVPPPETSEQVADVSRLRAWLPHVRAGGDGNHPVLVLVRKEEPGFVDDSSAYEEVVSMLQILHRPGRRGQAVVESKSAERAGVTRFSSEVAHDLNNILTVIRGNCELLERSLGQPDASREALHEINRAEEQAVLLTRQLQAFLTNESPAPQTLDLTKVLADSAGLVRSVLGPEHELILGTTSAEFPVKIVRGQIERVLLNLAANARDAMPCSGRLTLRLSLVENPEVPSARPGTYVLLAVSDSGVGVDESIRDHLFEPFRSTKTLNQGLGLAITHSIIEQAGGCIDCLSEAGTGTTFRIFLPCARDLPKAKRPASDVAATETHTVLLVEDEPLVRNLFRRILQASSYFVLEAASGPEALFLIQQVRMSIDLLITDLSMPHMSGVELAKRLTLEHPETKVLYLSGYGEGALEGPSAAHGGAFLSKPCTADALLDKVRDALRDRVPQG
ncbi:MAG: response regulator [Planctomycetes bacterium]|nr:response regulator [Planctomycetota bacterium]